MSGLKPSPTNWPQVAKFVNTHNDTYPSISPEKVNLSGKSVLITGASKGIGKATACRFAAAGCSRIAIAARSSLAEVKEAIKSAAAAHNRPVPEILSLQIDVSSEESVRTAAETYQKAFGDTLDVLINNAGYLEKWDPIAEGDLAEWWKCWDVNVKGMYLCCRYFLPLLRRSAAPTVINVSSAGGHNINVGASAYQTARFAAMRLNEFIEMENADVGLVSVAIHPGAVRTELGLNLPAFMHERLNDEPELAGDTMVWLAREKREWLGGRFISVCWDVDELEARKAEIVEKDLLKFRMVI